MGVGESFAYLAKSQYIRDLAWLVREGGREGGQGGVGNFLGARG